MKLRSSTKWFAVALACALGAAGCGDNSTTVSPAADAGRNGGKGSDPLGGPPVVGSCVNVFTGITHCPVGNGVVTGSISPASVLATNLAASSDGVSSSFAAASEWSQTGKMSGLAAGSNMLEYSVVASNGSIPSTFTVQQQGTSGTLELGPTFTGDGASYTARIYSNGELQAMQMGIGMGRRVIVVFADEWALWNTPPWVLKYYNIDKWSLLWTSGVRVVLPNGLAANGDHVEFTRDTGVGQAVPGTFTEVRVQGIADSYKISAESVMP